jgi:hypothetical protein
MMSMYRLLALLALLCVGVTSLSGCVVEHRRDGGVTFRPLH